MSLVNQDSRANAFLADVMRNWVVLLTMALGGAGVWGSTQATVSSLRDDLVKQERKVEKLEEQIATSERNGTEKLGALQRDVNEVKISNGRIETALQLLMRQWGINPQPGIGRQ